MVITSSSNKQVKNVMQLMTKASARREQKLFVVEGIKMFMETPANEIEKVYVAESCFKENKQVSDKIKALSYEVVKDSVFKEMSGTVTPQGVMALVRQRKYDIEEIINNKEKRNGKQVFIVLEGLQDPGNMGTIIRTAEGAGVAAIIMDKATVDIYNPKVIRSTMGSIFRVPFIIFDNLEEAMEILQKNEIVTYAAHLKGNIYYDEANFKESSAILIGNEGNGLSDAISRKADRLIKIPMCGQVESLNASVAAAILMYEASKSCN